MVTVPVRRVEDGAVSHAVHGGEDGVAAADVAQRGAAQVARAAAQRPELDHLLRRRRRRSTRIVGVVVL